MEEKIVNYRYKLGGIDIIEKSLFKYSLKEDVQFNFELKTQSLVDDSKDLIVILVLVGIKKTGEPELLGKILIGFGYIVENLKDTFEKNEKNLYVIPQDFENLLKAISISTTRGIMYSEFRGTYLHTAVLPIIFPDTLKPVAENIVEIVDGKVVHNVKG